MDSCKEKIILLCVLCSLKLISLRGFFIENTCLFIFHAQKVKKMELEDDILKLQNEWPAYSF